MAEAACIGVVAGSAASPVVSYLSKPVPVDGELLALADPVEPTEVFRFGAPCAEGGCQHFSDGRCGLARQLVDALPESTRKLPRCGIRDRCRWFKEQGPAACRRCPLVVTLDHRAPGALRSAAAPAQGAVRTRTSSASQPT
jgi:hypothetical protein